MGTATTPWATQHTTNLDEPTPEVQNFSNCPKRGGERVECGSHPQQPELRPASRNRGTPHGHLSLQALQRQDSALTGHAAESSNRGPGERQQLRKPVEGLLGRAALGNEPAPSDTNSGRLPQTSWLLPPGGAAGPRESGAEPRDPDRPATTSARRPAECRAR